ncbi:1,4-dihydroxy-2-naphthoyl-CoA thioesterase 1 isoform X1 [Dendrobium catenatum]|uniref:1,4-dihydroxy-2-naphthoyl-CoA thioesterase 1 isoform X1 n=1 Tax=Dendrobium catenatum TaxID=906689 RepID=UPI0009F6CC1A|nr:1,4-dihydroxy-2-naphthoyl-CoA thioesterase 1 isoform X1 [Dendrobium catenatum]
MASRNLGSPSPPSPVVPSTSKTAELDLPLSVLGFEIDVVSAVEITGHLRVTDHCCQPFKVLHGGVSALISEGLASIGAHVASGFRRIAGIHLSVDHLRSAAVGDLVFARAAPVHKGRTIQVWEVLIWKMNQSTMEKEALITSSKVTILSNLPIPQNAKDADVALRKYAKL